MVQYFVVNQLGACQFINRNENSEKSIVVGRGLAKTKTLSPKAGFVRER